MRAWLKQGALALAIWVGTAVLAPAPSEALGRVDEAFTDAIGRFDSTRAKPLRKQLLAQVNLTEEAQNLGDLSGTPCSSNAIGARMNQLKVPQYKGVPGVEDLVWKLQHAQNLLSGAEAELRSGVSQIRDAKTAYHRRLAKMPLNDAWQKLKALPADLDCSRMRGRIENALADLDAPEREAAPTAGTGWQDLELENLD